MQYPSAYPERSCIYTNQFIFRCIGPDGTPFVSKRENSKISLHVDESDESIIQPLVFLPMGGKNGGGGALGGTDLLLCEKKTGGKVARIVTVAEDTVVVVAFDGATMLCRMVGQTI